MKDMLKLKEMYGDAFKGRVVRILDNTSLIIDIGSDDIDVGDIVQVYTPLGTLEGIDGEILGSLEEIKAQLKVIRVEPSYAICKTQKKTGASRLSHAVTPMLDRVQIQETFAVNEDECNPFPTQDLSVHVGDPVKFA